MTDQANTNPPTDTTTAAPEHLIAEFIEQYEVQDARVWAQSATEAAPELVERLASHGYVIRQKEPR